MKTDWAPASYLKFEDERTRAARDLLARVRAEGVRRIVDVGCGPGNSTEWLAMRYPEAEVLGLDNSPAMLEEARRRLPNVRFELANAEVWVPDAAVDLVFANAIYQWVPRHLEQLRRVLAALRGGAILAVQMPDNLSEPTHRLMREVALASPWSGRLAGAARDPLPPARAYYEALRPMAARLDIWRTTYHHVLRSAEAIVEFVRATGLRPFLDPLSEPERTEFIAIYTAKIAAAYPPLADGNVLLAFPRLFLTAERGAAEGQ
jgi:trans-aconitate 2-methyltransferase